MTVPLTLAELARSVAGLDVRIWEIGAGLAIRIKTPNGQNHLIDAGGSPDFSPAEHIADNHWRRGDRLDLLAISHFDADHIEDLPNVVRRLGYPGVILRNNSVPFAEKVGAGVLDYQKVIATLEQNYTAPISPDTDPLNPLNNGGVFIEHFCNPWGSIVYTSSPSNNSSMVIAYNYRGTTIVFPGDIEDAGWKILRNANPTLFAATFSRTQKLVLVAPHHGRTSGYSQDMINFFKPDLIVVSDGYGDGATDTRFRTAGSGLLVRGELKSLITTKTKGRKKIVVLASGDLDIHEPDF